MDRKWLHIVALSVFALIGIAWGLIKLGVIGTVPSLRPPDRSGRDFEEIPVTGVAGFPARYFEGEGSIRGLLLAHPGGQPVEGATVMLAADPAVKVTTTGDGRFMLYPVPASFDGGVRVQTRSGNIVGMGEIPVTKGAGVDLGTLWAGGVTQLAGTVKGPDGKPVPGAVLTLHSPMWTTLRGKGVKDLPFHRRPPATGRVVSDPKGAFAFDAVPRGRTAIVVRARGYAPLWGVLDVTPEGEDAFRFDPVLEAAVPIHGFVVGADGNPVPDVPVVVVSDPTAGEAVLTARHAITNGDGRFTFTMIRRPDEHLFVFAGNRLYTWDGPLIDGMIVRLK